MKTQKQTAAWILISCTLIAASNGNKEHASPQHNARHRGETTTVESTQNTITASGIQIPENVLSTQDVACISADDNIFQMIDEAQKNCNGTDMRCTFYHFVDHGYNKIGTLDVNKELFDDLLMKFDNWLLTAESIHKADVPGKTHGDSSSHTASINVNDRYKNAEDVDNSSNDDKIHNHHIKHPDETHHKNHHHKFENHIKLDTEFNKQHSYFEVFIPEDKETGEPRTIYVEVDRDKNEFVLLDEDIDKKLNGVKPIKIELDELSEIADRAFNKITKSVHHKGHINNQLIDDGRIFTSDVYTNSLVGDQEIHHNIELDEPVQNISNSFVCRPSICNINATQKLISDKTTGNIKKIVNVSKNLVVPNKYIHHAQFNIESHVDNATDIIPNTDFEILPNINETDFHDTFVIHENDSFDTIEFDHNNITDLDMDNENNSSLDYTELPYENEVGNLTENDEFSNDNENVTYDDYDFVELTDNSNTSNYIDSDDDQNFSSPNAVHLTEPILQEVEPVKKSNLETTPHINAKPKLTPFLSAAISDYTSSQIDEIIAKNRQRNTDFNNQHPGSNLQNTQYTAVPILGKDLAKAVKTDSHLQSSFPVYATLDLPESDSQNPLLNSDFEHTSITSPNWAFNSVPGHQNIGHKIPQPSPSIFSSPPVDCDVRLSKGSKYSPLNLGYSQLPSYSRIEEQPLPCPSSQDFISPLLLPSKDISGNPQSLSPDSFTVTSSIQSAPSPFHLEPNSPMSPKQTILPSKLDFSTPNFERIPTIPPLSVSPYSTIEATNSPFQIIPPYIQPTNDNLKETMIPCAANINRYPCNTMPYYLNPYLKLSSYTPQYSDPLPGPPLQPIPNIPLLDLPIDQSHSSNADLQRETKPMPFLQSAPNTSFQPLNPLSLGPGFFSNTSPNIWNSTPYQTKSCLPYNIVPGQIPRNYPSVLSNYLTPNIDLQPYQIYKPLLSKEFTESVLEQPCAVENLIYMTPSSYTPISSVYTRPVQMDLNPSSALERDLQNLSIKYGIPLTNILKSIEADISSAHSKTSSPIFEIHSTLSIKNVDTDDENRIAHEEIFPELDNLAPLDTSLVGPHLEMDALLDSNDSQTYTVLSETTELQHKSVKKQPKFYDSSLIDPHLPTIPATDFNLSDEDRIGNQALHKESDSSPLIPFDSSLIGPHLNIGSPPVVLDSNISQSEIIILHTEEPITLSSQNKVNHNQTQQKSIFLDSSSKRPHLQTLYPAKPLLSQEIQIINEMTPLESDLTKLTPLESSHEDVVTKLEQLEILQNNQQAHTSFASEDRKHLHESKTVTPNIIEEELLESDSSKLMPLDSSLIGLHLQTEKLPIITNSEEDKSILLTSQNSYQNININDDELESIILPSSLLPTLLNKPVNSDMNFNIQTQDTQMNEEVDELSLESNVDIASIEPSLEETDFQVVEATLNTLDSTTLKHKLKSPHIIHSELQLDNSLTGPSLVHKVEIPKLSSILDSSIPLDSSLIGPSLLQEANSQDMTPILDTADHLEPYLGSITLKQNTNHLKNAAAIDSKVQFDSSLIGPSLYQEMKPQEANIFDSVTHVDNSLVGPSLLEDTESSVMQSVLGDNRQKHNSLKGLKQEIKTKDISHALESKNLLDSSLIGPHLSTTPFSKDEIKMINKELQIKSDHTNLKPLDSSLIGPDLNFEHQDEESEISRYENTELDQNHFKPLDSSLIGLHLDLEHQIDELEISRYQNPESSNLGKSPLRPAIQSSVSSSDIQELLSKFTQAITKSHLLSSEMKPCDKLLSSIAKISDNKNIQSCDDLQTVTYNTLTDTPLSLQDELLSEFYPSETVLEQEFLPVHSIIEGQPCLNSNLFPNPMAFTEYAKGLPTIPMPPSSPFVQMKPHTDRNWVGAPLNIQNVLQTTPGYRPIEQNSPLPFSITPEDFKLLSDLASQSNLYPQSYDCNLYKQGEAIPPSPGWTIPSQILPVDKYIPSYPKKTSSGLPFNLKSTVCDSEYNPIVVDDIKSLIDQYSFQLPKYKSTFSSLPTIKGEMVCPSFLNTTPISNTQFIKSRPVLDSPMANKMFPSAMFTYPPTESYNPQMTPCMTQTPYITPFNLQPYFNIPLEAQFSQIIGPAPELVSLPTESPNKFTETLANSRLEKEYLQQLLSKPFLDSPILPSSVSNGMLKLPTATNELNGSPYPLPPVYYTPISPTPSILPTYANPLSVSYAKAKPTSSIGLNVPSPFTSSSLSVDPYTCSPPVPEFSSPLLPIKTTLSDYSYLPTELHSELIPSADTYKPCHGYSSPYLPVYPTSPSIDSNPNSFVSGFTPALASPYFPADYHLTSVPYLRPVQNQLTNIGIPAYSAPLTPVSLCSMGPSHTGSLSSSYVSPDTTYYQPLTDLIESLKRPASGFSPAYITPVSKESSNLSPNIKFLPNFPSSSASSPNPQLTMSELQLLGLINTLPSSYVNNPISNANQRLQVNPNGAPIQSYPTHIPKSSPLSNSQITQNIPCDHVIQSNLQTSPLTEEEPFYNVIEENIDEDDEYYEEPRLKFPLESMSYTLASEENLNEIGLEHLPDEDFVEEEGIITYAPITNLDAEASLQTKSNPTPCLAPYTPIYGKPCPAQQFLSPPTLIENIQQNIFDNIPLMPSPRPLKYPDSKPTTFPSNPVLKSAVTPSNNLLSLPYSCIDTSVNPFYILPMPKKPLPSSPHYPSTSLHMSSPLTDPRLLKNTLPPVLFQVPMNSGLVSAPAPITSPISQPTAPYISNGELSPTYIDPKSKILQDSLLKPSSTPSCNQYIAPSYFPPIEQSSQIPQYVTSLTPGQNSKYVKPLSPEYKSSILPVPSIFQESVPLNDVPIYYKPYVTPNGFAGPAKNNFKSPLVTSPYIVSPTFNNIVEPVSTDHKPQWISSVTPHYSLPTSFSTVPTSSPMVSNSNKALPVTTPPNTKQVFTNHIIPSSLFTIPDTDLRPSPKKISHLQSTARYSSIEPLETIPYYTPTRHLDATVNPQDRLKINTPLFNGLYTSPLSILLYSSHPLDMKESYPSQPSSQIQYTAKPTPILSPILPQYATSSLSPNNASIPLETLPNRQVYNIQYSFPSDPILEVPNYTTGNLFTNQNFKPILEVPAYPVPKNLNSSPKITPFDSVLLSNLKSVDISQGFPETYSSPITCSVPLHSPSFLKPLQKSRHPQIIPNYSPYVSELPIDIVPELLPSPNPFLKNPLLKPLLTSSQNNSPLLPIDLSHLTAFPYSSPIKSFSSPSSNVKYISSSASPVSGVPEHMTPINSLPSSQYSVLKSPSDIIKNMPSYSNYKNQEPRLSLKTNIVNSAQPMQAYSAIESLPLTHESSYTEMIDEKKPVSDLEFRLLPLPINLDKLRHFNPAFTSKYSTLPQPHHKTSVLYPKFKTLKSSPDLTVSSRIPEESELIDTTGFLPLSQIKSERVTDYIATDRTASIFKNTPSVEPDNSQYSPYTLLNTDFSSPSYKHLPSQFQTSSFSNQRPELTPYYLSPKEYKDLIKATSSSQASSPSPAVLASTNTEPQFYSDPMTKGQASVPYYTNNTPKNRVLSPIFTKYLPHNEVPLEVPPEKESIQTILNKYRPTFKIAAQRVDSYPYELISSTSEGPFKLKNIKPIPLTQSGTNTKYEDLCPNNFNEYDSETSSYDLEPEYVEVNENKPVNIETKSFTQILPEIIEGFSDSNYDNIAPRPQRLSKLDNLYANNHIGKGPQVLTDPIYNTLSIAPATDVIRPLISKKNFEDLTEIHTKNIGSVPKLDNTSLRPRPSEFYTEISNSPKNLPVESSYTINELIPSPQTKFPSSAIEVTDTSDMSYKPIPYTPYNNMEGIKYSGYKTYQIPSFKSAKATQNLGSPTKMYDPSVVPHFTPIPSVKPLNIEEIPSSSHLDSPTEINEHDNPQYRTTEDMKTPLLSKLGLKTLQESPESNEYTPLSQYHTPVATPLQTKLDLNNLQESPVYDEYNPTENVPISVENTNEGNDLKISLINYINQREDIKQNINNNNDELTIPIGNIAITKKESPNADTIETNNPSINLKVWKSNVKIAQAELKLKLKDLSVNNFMPVVNNLDKYDMEEIRKIVKNYIDEKYGAHIEVKEPYTVDNQYAVIKDFDHNADSKYNLLWPANYV